MSQQRRRTHNLLLISKLLGQRDHVSPFTLVSDSLEQTAKPLLREYCRRAKLSKTPIIFLSFETFFKPADVETFVACFDQSPLQISQAVAGAIAAISASSKRMQNRRIVGRSTDSCTGCVVLIDSLTTLEVVSTRPNAGLNLTAFLSSLLQPPKQNSQLQISVVAVHHTDVPFDKSTSSYAPTPFSLLSYLATTVITVHSLPILLAEKAARDRSQAMPLFGLSEESEGVLIGLASKGNILQPEDRGLVLEVEHRRRSGRGVLEWYFLPVVTKQEPTNTQVFREIVTLLDDHPHFRKQREEQIPDQELTGMTFELGLTNRQRQEREGVVLPYFDAQKTGGGGEGGRILYDMGVEDDFDEEEDDI